MEPKKIRPPECAALAALRHRSGLRSWQAAEKARLPRQKWSNYENSEIPPEDHLPAMLEAVDSSHAEYAAVAISLGGQPAGAPPPLSPALPPWSPVDPEPEEWRSIGEIKALASRQAEDWAEESLLAIVRGRKAAAARAEAETLCSWLLAQTRPGLIARYYPKVHTWSVAEALAHRSTDIATADPARALELAELACLVAERVSCPEPFRQDLLGYIYSFRENAVRALLGAPDAGLLHATAEALRNAGPAGPLALWRLLDLEASLLRDQRKPDAALDRLDAAWQTAPKEARGRLLLNRATVLGELGRDAEGLALLDEAAGLIDRRKDPRLHLILLFNRATALCRLGRHGDASLLLAPVRKQAAALGEELVLQRSVWLEASIHAGIGRWRPATDAYKKAITAAVSRLAAWDCGMITLELATGLCRQGRTAEAADLAVCLDWILDAEALGPEALAALRLFHDEAERNAVTPGLAERALELFRQAPKTRAPTGKPTRRQAELAAFAAAGTLAERTAAGGSGGTVATTIGVHDAAPVQ